MNDVQYECFGKRKGELIECRDCHVKSSCQRELAELVRKSRPKYHQCAGIRRDCAKCTKRVPITSQYCTTHRGQTDEQRKTIRLMYAKKILRTQEEREIRKLIKQERDKIRKEKLAAKNENINYNPSI